MKGRKENEHRRHRETGGTNEAEMDLKTKPEARTNASNIDREADERKRGGGVHGKECKCKECMGGRAKRKRGGMAEMHEKHEMKVEGEHAKHHAGRKPRKAGGRATSDANPFTSARAGTPAKGRKLEMEFE